MSTVFDRLDYNFSSSKFGTATTLSDKAANTLNLISSNTPQMKQWQIDDLKSGTPVRTNYFKNPTNSTVSNIIVVTTNIKNTANTIMSANTDNVVGGGTTTGNVFVTTDQINAASILYSTSQNLIITLNAFKSHTDNISGVTFSTSPDVPCYESAAGMGQMNMLTITKTDGIPDNTVPILGSFTSLFIQTELSSNNNTLTIYNNEFNVNSNSTFIQTISNYANSTGSLLNTRRTHDWNFFKNSNQIMRDSGFLQQFTNVGATQNYLLRNVIGTTSLITKLNSD